LRDLEAVQAIARGVIENLHAAATEIDSWPGEMHLPSGLDMPEFQIKRSIFHEQPRGDRLGCVTRHGLRWRRGLSLVQRQHHPTVERPTARLLLGRDQRAVLSQHLKRARRIQTDPDPRHGHLGHAFRPRFERVPVQLDDLPAGVHAVEVILRGLTPRVQLGARPGWIKPEHRITG
jgi:hypothetical protein